VVYETTRVLLIEDDPDDMALIQRMFRKLEKPHFKLKVSKNLNEGLKELSSQEYHVLLLDLNLPDSAGFDTFIRVIEQASKIPIIILTGLSDEELGVKTVREGAQDYLVKGEFDQKLLARSIEYAIERKRAEQALRESEEYQRTIFSSIHTGIIVVDEKTHEILDVNPVAADLIGVSKEKIVGNICHKYVCPADEGKCPISDLDQVVDNSERVLLDVNGNEIPILKTVIPVKLGGRECLLESFIDITERKRMEEALRHSEESFRALAEDSIDIIMRHDRKHSHLYVNPVVEKFTGILPEDFTGKTHKEMGFPKDLVELWEKAIDKVFKTKKNNHIEFKLPKGIWIDALLVPEFDKKGEVKVVLTSARDITERKKMEMVLSWEVAINNALAKLSRKLLSQASIEDISRLVLEYSKDLTRSKHGFVGYISPETGYLIIPTTTRDFWEECEIKDKSMIFKTFQGLWGWVLNNKESILTNDPAWDPRSTGTPEGHIPINSFVSAPAMIEDKLVGQIALANADHDYTKKDLELVERLADLYAIAINRQLLEEKIRESEEKHRKIVEKFLETVSEE